MKTPQDSEKAAYQRMCDARQRLAREFAAWLEIDRPTLDDALAEAAGTGSQLHQLASLSTLARS